MMPRGSCPALLWGGECGPCGASRALHAAAVGTGWGPPEHLGMRGLEDLVGTEQQCGFWGQKDPRWVPAEH